MGVSGQFEYPAGLPKQKELPVPTSQFAHFQEKKTLLPLPGT